MNSSPSDFSIDTLSALCAASKHTSVTIDKQAETAYINLSGEANPSVFKTITLDNGILLDFSKMKVLLGIELLDLSILPLLKIK